MRAARAAGRALLLMVVWPVRTVPRLLTLGWLIACGAVGGALQAAADGDGLINGPDLGGADTVFERIPLTYYTLPFGLSDSETGFPYVKEVMWEAFRGIGNVLLYVTLAVVKGAITCMQWMLNLTIYRDNSGEIDRAVQSLAGAVFWPMLAVTVAIAAASAYGRMKQHGGGSIFNDALWMITATTIAVTFAVAPSKVAGTLDDVRTSLSGAITQGYTSSTSADSVAGFPDTPTGAGKDGATRALSDAMWNVYAVAPWCWAAFGSLDVCKDVGHEYLDDTTRWKDLYNTQRGMNGEGADTDSAKCPDEYQSQCTWVRGQSFGRLGGALFAALIGIPLAVMLMVLVVFGIMSIVGLILLTLIGLLFLLLWMIPGKPRAIGVRWFEALLGSLLQAVLITALLGAVMVLAGIFNAMLPTYGLFMVALLNVAALIMVFKIRGMFENMTGLASPGSSHIASGYMGARLLGSVAGGARKLGVGTTKAAVGTATAAGKTGMKVAQVGTNQILNPNSATSKATRGTMAALKAGLDLASQSGTPAPTPKRTVHATPYRTAPAAPHQLGNGVHVQPTARAASAPAAQANQLTTSGPVTVNGGRALTAGNSGVPRLALPAAASSTTTVSPPTRKGGQPTYVAGSGTPGVVSSAQRRIVQPSRRNVQTPPVTGPRTIGIGSGTSAYTVTRSLAPITPRTPAAPVTPSSPRRSPGPRVVGPSRAEKST